MVKSTAIVSLLIVLALFVAFPIAACLPATSYAAPVWLQDPALVRVEAFLNHFPATRKPGADREEIIRETMAAARIINQSPAWVVFDRPEGAMCLLLSQQAAESEMNRNAHSSQNLNGTYDLGLSQQNSRYLRARGITDWRSIEQQCKAQAKFMASLLQQSMRHGGDRALRSALAGYTAGPWCARRGVVPDIGRTRAHVARIMRYYRMMCPAQAARPGIYVVQPGDTLWQIAQRFGTTVERLARANGIHNPDRITAGERLEVGR
jgi:hypothetical protein